MSLSRPRGPRDFPEYRSDVVYGRETWERAFLSGLLLGRSDFEHISNIRAWFRSAELWWVGADACTLVNHAAPTMPPATLSNELQPQEAGLVLWETTIAGIAADTDNPLPVDMVLWYPTRIRTDDGGVSCTSMISFRIEDGLPIALGRSDWPLGSETDDPLPGEVDEKAIASVSEDRRLMAAIWQLSSQDNVTESSTVKAHRAAAKRLERADRDVSDVRLVDLRARHRTTSESDTNGPGRQYSHQWVVEGHWRQVAYGPGRAFRRPRYILPYIAGPDDMPLVIKDPVKVWRK